MIPASEPLRFTVPARYNSALRGVLEKFRDRVRSGGIPEFGLDKVARNDEMILVRVEFCRVTVGPEEPLPHIRTTEAQLLPGVEFELSTEAQMMLDSPFLPYR